MGINVNYGWFQYNIDLRGIGASRGSAGGDEDGGGGGGGAGGDGKMGVGGGTDGSIWQMGMARRAKGDARRTRVSFLLFWIKVESHTPIMSDL